MPPSKPHLLLGIDPGTTVGLAIYDTRTDELLVCTSGDFFRTHAVVKAQYPPHNVAAVIVEDARSLPLYARHRHASRAARDRVARNVGGVDKVTELVIQWLEDEGYLVTTEKPQRRKKWDAATLARLTGCTAPTNEHGRDAARLVVGRGPQIIHRLA
ncbi:MAG: hypothetical protein AAGJ10_14425 [Bacteroidota bacterium]